MHYHCEIVMPPTDDIEAAVSAILKPFNENNDDRDEDYSDKHAFWDFWSIGGRWGGTKLTAKYDPEKIDEFYAWCKAEKITVSGLQCGKQELSPETQIPKVDAKWNEMFPEGERLPCPLFAHSGDRYNKTVDGALPGDVQPLGLVPERLTCSRVIFAVPSYDSDTKKFTGPVKADFMLADTAWNGCNHMPVDWDGKLHSAVAKYRESLKNYKDELALQRDPKADWLVVTVDYHS